MNQKGNFSKTSKMAFLAWAAWILLVLTFVWPAHERTVLPTTDDTFPSFAISGNEEQQAPLRLRTTEFKVQFQLPQALANIENLAIKIGTFRRTVELHRIALWLDSVPCEVLDLDSKSNRPKNVEDLSYLSLPVEELRKCLSQLPMTKQTQLTMRITTNMPVVLIGNSKRSETVENPGPFVKATDGSQQWVDGRFRVEAKRTQSSLEQLSWPRFRLMAEIWGAESSTSVLGFFALLMLGASLLSWSLYSFPKTIRTSVLGKASVWAPVLGFMGSNLLTSLIAPPFQAADEADHFRTFLSTTQLQHRDQDALKLAQRSHYDRLMCHRDQRLSIQNLQCPMTHDWPGHAGLTEGPARSLVADLVWKGFARILPANTMNIGLLHWSIRILNGLFVTITFFLGLKAILGDQNQTEDSKTEENMTAINATITAMTVLSIPTLTHFSNHNSNHAFLIASYIFIAINSLSILRKDRLNKQSTFLLSIFTTLSVFAGRAGVLLWLITFGLFCIRWFTKENKADRIQLYLRETFQSSSIFLPVILVATLFYEHPYVQSRIMPLFHDHSHVGIIALIVLVMIAPSSIMTFGSFSFNTLNRIKDFSELFFVKRKTSLTSIALVLFILFLFSALIKYPAPIPNIEFSPPMPVMTYVWLVLKSFIRNSAIAGEDFLLIGSFWGGFGCPVDSLHWFPLWLIHCLLIGGWLFGITKKFTSHSQLEAIRLFLFGALCFLYLGLLTYAVHSGPSTMHGRYMVGFYLFYIIGSIWGWVSFGKGVMGDSITKILAMCCTCALIFHIAGIISLIYQFY